MRIVRAALIEQARIYKAAPAYPVRIMLYNNQQEFNAWQAGGPDFIVGRAFPAQGVTAQVVRPGVDGERWLQAVIPHELAKLHFYRATYCPQGAAPRWLDEGLALYAEPGAHAEKAATLQAAVLRRALRPSTL